MSKNDEGNIYVLFRRLPKVVLMIYLYKSFSKELAEGLPQPMYDVITDVTKTRKLRNDAICIVYENPPICRT